MRIDDDEARLVVVEMPFDQGQRAFADRAEADHDNGAGNPGVDGVIGRAHRWGLRTRDALRARKEIRMMESERGVRFGFAWRSLRSRSSFRASGAPPRRAGSPPA